MVERYDLTRVTDAGDRFRNRLGPLGRNEVRTVELVLPAATDPDRPAVYLSGGTADGPCDGSRIRMWVDGERVPAPRGPIPEYDYGTFCPYANYSNYLRPSIPDDFEGVDLSEGGVVTVTWRALDLPEPLRFISFSQPNPRV